MWSAVFGLQLQFMRFIATCTEWDPDERQEWDGFYRAMRDAREYWVHCPELEAEIHELDVQQPDDFYETVKKAFEVYRAAAEGPTSSVVWPRSLLEDLDDLFVEIYDGYKLPLGERGEACRQTGDATEEMNVLGARRRNARGTAKWAVPRALEWA